MIQKVLSFIKQHHMIERGDHILAAVSGGADSVCMLLVLKELQKQLDYIVTAVHVEHGIRGEESIKDAEFVKELCSRLSVDCEVFCVNAVSFADNKGMSLEEGARELRYDCFAKGAAKWGADKIAVAHNRNDCGETLLFHLIRGSGLKGMRGIAPVRDNIIRPLLCVERKEIEAYLRENHQGYQTDATNQEILYSRNKLRHQVLPVLEEINTGAVEHLYRSTEVVSEALEVIDHLTAEAKEACANGGFLKEELLSFPVLIQKTVVMDALGRCAGSRKNLSEVHVKEVLGLMEKQTGRRINLPYGMSAYRTYGGIMLENGKEHWPDCDMQLDAKEQFCAGGELLRPGESIMLGEEGMKISCRIMEKMEEICEIPKKTYTKWFDYDKIENSVLLRKRCPGDYFIVDEKGSRQKLKRYFVNEKVPAHIREKIPVLAEGDHVLWIVGYRISEAYKITKNTRRILEVQVSGGNIHE